MTSALSLLDQTIIALYMGSILVISALIARKQRTGDDYFLAGRSMNVRSTTSLWETNAQQQSKGIYQNTASR